MSHIASWTLQHIKNRMFAVRTTIFTPPPTFKTDENYLQWACKSLRLAFAEPIVFTQKSVCQSWTVADSCSNMLHILLLCTDCGMNCHKLCKDQVAFECKNNAKVSNATGQSYTELNARHRRHLWGWVEVMGFFGSIIYRVPFIHMLLLRTVTTNTNYEDHNLHL